MRATLLWTAALLAATIGSAAAQNEKNEKYDVARTTVAILPVVNTSGEKDAAQKVKQAESAQTELVKRWTERGFAAVENGAVQKAIADLKIDLNDEEQQKRANLISIGKAVKADLVMFVVITDVSQRTSVNIFSTTREGKAKLKAWLLDVNSEKQMFSAKVCEGKSTGGHFGMLEKGSERIVLAAANGIRDLLKDFFQPYPVVKKETKQKD